MNDNDRKNQRFDYSAEMNDGANPYQKHEGKTRKQPTKKAFLAYCILNFCCQCLAVFLMCRYFGVLNENPDWRAKDVFRKMDIMARELSSR